MQRALAGITAGDFDERVEVANRDEFGKLAQDLNGTSARLATLFDEQRMFATQLGQTNASLERASEAKSRFLANVSHELRTPMTAILGFTDALLAGVDGPLNEEQRASLGWVQRGGRHLLGLINDILDLSKIESGKLTIDAESFDPREVVEAVVAQHRSLAAQKGLRLAWRNEGMPAAVVLDRQRVRQILVNLIGNAMKFTDTGEVDVEAGSAADGGLRVAVRDTGPGIPLEQQEVIFDEFHRAKRQMMRADEDRVEIHGKRQHHHGVLRARRKGDHQVGHPGGGHRRNQHSEAGADRSGDRKGTNRRTQIGNQHTRRRLGEALSDNGPHHHDKGADEPPG